MSIITTPTINTVGSILVAATERLQEHHVLRPRRHVELLLEHVLDIDRTQLYLTALNPVNQADIDLFNSLLERRVAGEPVQYIIGWTPFYGQRFLVGEGVFIPRFDTEVMVEHAVSFLNMRNTDPAVIMNEVEILDICCGCGAIGLSIAAETPDSRVTLSDNSGVALDYARSNARELGMNDRTNAVNWDALTEPPDEWRHRFDVVVANPPYIPVDELLDLHLDVREGEPRPALTDEGDGMSFYRRWMETLPAILKPGGKLLVEVGDGAVERVGKILSGSFSNLTEIEDISGVLRVTEAGI